MSDIRIGISGWRYAPWRGTFYPEDLPQRRELEYAASKLNAIEINGTFYSLQRPEHFRRWRDETPDDFVFAVKGSRYITHLKRLKDIEAALPNFFAQGLFALGPKLGPILWQFPQNFSYEPERVEAFLSALPKTAADAAALAKRHDARLRGRALTEAVHNGKVRHAMEVRSESFVCAAFIAQLRRHGVALVAADTPSWPRLFDVTADFVYVRMHGAEELYASGYDDEELDAWAGRVAAWSKGEDVEGEKASPKPARMRKSRDVHVYFDNDIKVRAPYDAQRLREKAQALLAGGQKKRAARRRTRWKTTI